MDAVGRPIENLMRTTMENIRTMVDVNTVVGDAVETDDGTVIIPVSRVSFGFAAGGGEYRLLGGAGRKADGAASDGGEAARELPFAGGTGVGVTVQPVGFLVVGQGHVRLLPVTDRAIYDRLIDLASDLLDRFGSRRRRGATDGVHFEEDAFEEGIELDLADEDGRQGR